MVVALGLTALITVVLFFWPRIPLALAFAVAEMAR